jgi:hypothetical protein
MIYRTIRDAEWDVVSGLQCMSTGVDQLLTPPSTPPYSTPFLLSISMCEFLCKHEYSLIVKNISTIVSPISGQVRFPVSGEWR